jgi:glycyl-tRNA synthetase
MFLAVLSQSYKEEKLASADGGEGNERVVLSIPPALAPVKAAILPLIKKDGLPEKAEAILNDLRFDFRCYYEDKDTIGKRYRRMDAIGTPFCITVDHQTIQDNTVTLRHRDSMKQDRVAIAALKEILSAACSMTNLLKKLQ